MKILIVDDESSMSEPLKEFFEFKGNEVKLAQDVKSAIAQIEEFNPSLVLLDMKLGEQSGIDVLQYLKDRNKQIKSVIMTGYADTALEQDALKLGAYAFVHKPANIAQLVKIVEDLE